MRALLAFQALICLQVTTAISTESFGPSTNGPRVETPLGTVQGIRLEEGSPAEVEAFLGVPFGLPPTGKLRFARSEPVQPWQGVLQATQKRFGCPQADQWLSRHLRLDYTNHSSEDCLTLNIWRPVTNPQNRTQDEGQLRPVFVFIYGGSFQWGSSDLFLYDGRAFAASSGTIFVSISYRVGLLGFANHPDIPELTGTAGLWDQNLALRWVQQYISFFGGDPTEVTVCGHSAGAFSAALHAISPHARGLFRRVILQSGTSLSLSTLTRIPRSDLRKVARNLGCGNDVHKILDCLRNVDATKLVQEADRMGHEGMALPPIESDYASLSPNHLEQAEFNIEQMIIGTTEHEANIFAKRAFETSENLRDVISGVGHMVSLVGILRSVFHTPIVESRRIVAAYFDEEREYSENELTELIAEAATDLFFACPAKFYAEAATSTGVGVYRYLFRHRPSYSLYEDIPGVLHGEELPFTLGNLRILKDLLQDDNVTQPDEVVRGLTFTPFEESLLNEIQQLWGSFTREGIPILSNNRSWPRYTESRRVFLDISDNGLSVRRGLPNSQRCRMWEGIVMQREASARSARDSVDYEAEEEYIEEEVSTEAENSAASESRSLSSIAVCVPLTLIVSWSRKIL